MGLQLFTSFSGFYAWRLVGLIVTTLNWALSHTDNWRNLHKAIWETRSGPTSSAITILTQRVYLDCQYGIRDPKAIPYMVFGSLIPYWQFNGTLWVTKPHAPSNKIDSISYIRAPILWPSLAPLWPFQGSL